VRCIIFPSPSARQHSKNITRCQNSQDNEKTDANSQEQGAILHHHFPLAFGTSFVALLPSTPSASFCHSSAILASFPYRPVGGLVANAEALLGAWPM
jgi:hypothetical protein